MAASTHPLRIISASGPAEQTLQELNRRMGFMAEFGVEPRYVRVTDGQKALAALLAGEGDVCIQIGIGPALVAAEQGVPIRILAGANLRAVHVVFSSVPRIRRIRDLEGARVGVGTLGALTHQMMTAILLKGGADPARVEFVTVGNSPMVFKAVTAREVDAGLGELDFVNRQAESGVHALEDGSLWDRIPEFTNQGAFTIQPAIDARRDLIVGALAASAKLYRHICGPDSWEDFLGAHQAAIPGADPHEARSLWDFYQERRPYAVDLVIGDDRIRYMQELNVAMGLQGRLLPFDEVADMSLAEDAIALLDG